MRVKYGHSFRGASDWDDGFPLLPLRKKAEMRVKINRAFKLNVIFVLVSQDDPQDWYSWAAIFPEI